MNADHHGASNGPERVQTMATTCDLAGNLFQPNGHKPVGIETDDAGPHPNAYHQSTIEMGPSTNANQTVPPKTHPNHIGHLAGLANRCNCSTLADLNGLDSPGRTTLDDCERNGGHLLGCDNNSDNAHDNCNGYETTTSTDRPPTESLAKRDSAASGRSGGHGRTKQRQIIRKFQKLDAAALSATPAPDVKIGQRVAYKEYYGNEFGTIRWIGRVPQISADWTAGVEFDNAIGEGDGSLNGRRYFIAKDCFAKFLPLDSVAFVDQHVGRPEPGTMISVMSASVRPGQMISIQRVSTVHVQHCFLNAPHRRPGADILAVNTRLHCQCPNCGPCAHVVKPPRTQRLRTGKNATHMCQFSTYTCCGMESSDEALCTYTGNKISSLPPPDYRSSVGLPPVGNSWIEGSGYLSQLQAQQSKLMPDEYRLGAAPQDANVAALNKSPATSWSRRGSAKGRHRHRRHHHKHHRHNENPDRSTQSPIYCNVQPSLDWTCSDNGAPNVAASVSDGNLRTPAAHQDWTNVTFGQLDTPRLAMDARDMNHDDGGHMRGQDSRMQDERETDRPSNDNDNDKDNANGHDRDHYGPPSSPKVHSEPARQEPNKTGPRILYRDSIDNRYLFPTDDAIDSTLEADLEDLSQARYGHWPNGGGGSASRGLATSKNILRSLRSLVSCLSARSNQSSEGFERRSENTLRFFGQPSADEANKSQPRMDRSGPSSAFSSSSSCWSSGSTSADCEQECSKARPAASLSCSKLDGKANADTTQTYGFKRPPKHRHHHHHHHHHHRHRPYPYPCPTYGTAQVPPYARNEHLYHPAGWPPHFNASSSGTSNGSQHEQNKQVKGDPPPRSPADSSSDGACSLWGTPFGVASRHEQLAGPAPQAGPASTAMQVRRQISSSSDCGFSSASQNSINYRSSYPSCSPIMGSQQQLDDDQRRINQIYKRIVAKLISSSPSAANIRQEDLLKLKGSLLEMHSNGKAGCCLHQSLDTSTQCDQIIADIIKESYLSLDNVASPKSAQCHRDHCGTPTITSIAGATDANISAGAPNDGVQSAHHEAPGEAPTGNVNEITHVGPPARPTANQDNKQAHQDNLCLPASANGAHQNHATSSCQPNKQTTVLASLPRAFELKLTLSINSDDAGKEAQASRANGQVSNGISPGGLIDINIAPWKDHADDNGGVRAPTTLPVVPGHTQPVEMSSLETRRLI